LKEHVWKVALINISNSGTPAANVTTIVFFVVAATKAAPNAMLENSCLVPHA
jgi:hypothetical protein